MTAPVLSPPALTNDVALFLDLDGTLIEIAAHPIDVVVPAGLTRTLKLLRDRLGGALALVSGRSLAQIDLLFAGYPFDLAASHGFECRDSSGRKPTREHPSAGFDKLVEQVIIDTRKFPGLYIERKAYSIAIHYRADPSLEGAAWSLARAGLCLLGGESALYRLQRGKAVVEIMPADAQKGIAIERFMESLPYLGRTPVFAGDDLTDESGFDAVNRLHGVTIHVGEPGAETHARYHLPSPAALRGWLGVG